MRRRAREKKIDPPRGREREKERDRKVRGNSLRLSRASGRLEAAARGECAQEENSCRTLKPLFPFSHPATVSSAPLSFFLCPAVVLSPWLARTPSSPPTPRHRRRRLRAFPFSFCPASGVSLPRAPVPFDDLSLPPALFSSLSPDKRQHAALAQLPVVTSSALDAPGKSAVNTQRRVGVYSVCSLRPTDDHTARNAIDRGRRSNARICQGNFSSRETRVANRPTRVKEVPLDCEAAKVLCVAGYVLPSTDFIGPAATSVTRGSERRSE